MRQHATYILIKSSVLSVTDHQKPSLDGVTSAAQFKRLNDFFNESFIKVDNPEVAIRAITAPIQNKVTGLYDDGLYPVDGIEFEVKEETEVHYSQRDIEDGNVPMGATLLTSKLSAVVSLIDAKEEKKLPTLHEHNEKKRELYDKPADNTAGVACVKCGKEMRYKDKSLVTLSNPPMTQVICECGNSGYKVI